MSGKKDELHEGLVVLGASEGEVSESLEALFAEAAQDNDIVGQVNLEKELKAVCGGGS